MIVGMDRLIHFVDLIDCERQLVVVHTPSVGELTIYDEGTRVDSTFCSAARDIIYLQQGCMGYLAYVIDNREEKKHSISSVPVV